MVVVVLVAFATFLAPFMWLWYLMLRERDDGR